MGLFDLLKRNKSDADVTRSALDEARDPGENPGAITALIQRILDVGLHGAGPFPGADKVAGTAVVYSWDARGARWRFLARQQELDPGG